MINNKRLKKVPIQYQSKVRKTISDLIESVIQERTRRKISQDKFAEMLNLSYKTYQAYEQGSRKPSVETLVLMFLILDLPLLHIKK